MPQSTAYSAAQQLPCAAAAFTHPRLRFQYLVRSFGRLTVLQPRSWCSVGHCAAALTASRAFPHHQGQLQQPAQTALQQDSEAEDGAVATGWAEEIRSPQGRMSSPVERRSHNAVKKRPRHVRTVQHPGEILHLLRKRGTEASPAFWVASMVSLVRLSSTGKHLEPGLHQQLSANIARLLASAAADKVGTPTPLLAAFKPSQTGTLLWALARLRCRPAAEGWLCLKSHLSDSAGELRPRDTALVAWALVQLTPPAPADWGRLLLDAQATALPSYPARSLVMVLHAAARLGAPLPPGCMQQVLVGLGAQLAALPIRDLSQLSWSIARLHLRPDADFVGALLCASRAQLPNASCAELVALLVGVAGLRFLPPGVWLLELYDQLYWTADQLQPGQLAQVVWALGRLRLVAVPSALLLRLLAFSHARIAEELLHLGLTADPTSTSLEAATGGLQLHHNQQQQQQLDVRRYVVAKQLHWLLTGLRGLQRQLTPGQLAALATGWLVASLRAAALSPGPSSHRLVPDCLHAAGRLGVHLDDADAHAALECLQQLRPSLGHTGLALGLWGAVRVGCRPPQAWLDAWLGESTRLMPSANMVEVTLLLWACSGLWATLTPSQPWLLAASDRLLELMPDARPQSLLSAGHALLSLEAPSQQRALVAGLQARAAELQAQRRLPPRLATRLDACLAQLCVRGGVTHHSFGGAAI